MRRVSPSKILRFASTVEIGTGAILIVAPAIVCRLLLGVEISGTATMLGRFFGIALLCLGIACWPGADPAGPGSAPIVAMLTYNAVIALSLTYVGFGETGGALLWPAMALHAVIAAMLAFRK